MAAVHEITIAETAERFRCPEDRNVLVGMASLGRRGIPVGCRNGGCGVCKVHITSGQVTRKVMSRAHISAEEESAGYALACRIFPQSDVVVAVVGKMKRSIANPPQDNSIQNRQSE